jgi:hypothetical protein
MSGLSDHVTDLDKCPKILIGVPWVYHAISTGFCESLRNMYVPFPTVLCRIFKGRGIADARNLIVGAAIEGGFDYVMEIDADQYARPELFIMLWEVLRQYGRENVVASSWARLKTDKWRGRPCVFQFSDRTLVPLTEEDVRGRDGPFEADAIGTCGFLASTALFRRIPPPWHRDVYLIRPDVRVGELYAASEFKLGQDLGFSFAVREAGGKIIVEPKAFLEHEELPGVVGPTDETLGQNETT